MLYEGFARDMSRQVRIPSLYIIKIVRLNKQRTMDFIASWPATKLTMPLHTKRFNFFYDAVF